MQEPEREPSADEASSEVPHQGSLGGLVDPQGHPINPAHQHHRVTTHTDPPKWGGLSATGWQGVQAISGVLLLLVTGVLAVYAVRQWGTMHDTLVQIQQQTAYAGSGAQGTIAAAAAAASGAAGTILAASTASKQLELSERPWVDIEVSAVTPLTFGPTGGTVKITTRTINHGNSVAVDEYFTTDIVTDIPVVHDAIDFDKKQIEICNPAVRPYRPQKETLFPGKDYPNRLGTIEVSLSPASIKNALAISLTPGKISAALVVCVNYRASFSRVHYQTISTFVFAQNLGPGEFQGLFSPTAETKNVIMFPDAVGHFAN